MTEPKKNDKINPDYLKMQYKKLAEDWRYFNTLLWGIPSVAIAIMTGIIIASYQAYVIGWERIASLGLGSFLLFALTVESIKKRQHMDVIELLLEDLQKRGLELKDYVFPVGRPYDIEIYLKDHPKNPDDNLEAKNPDDKIFNFFKVFYAREVLTLVVFVSAIVVAALADYEFVNFFHNQWPQIAIAIIVPLIILVIVVYDQYRNKKRIQTKLEGSRKENEREKSGGAPIRAQGDAR
jgi:hypothetical protein